MTKRTTIVYDGECPFCSNYVAMVRLREAAGEVSLIDARQGGPLVEDLQAKGFDLDEGMALVQGDAVHYGDDAVHRIALLSSRSGLFNKMNAWIFSSPKLSAWLYPILRFGRNLTLRVLGRKKINA